MKDKFAFIETENRKYPIVFNLNVIEEIQEKYGSLEEWLKVFDADEPKFKDIKFGFKEMINEAIDILNEKNGTNDKFVTLKEVGRIITEAGLSNTTEKLKTLTVNSISTNENEKNE